VIGGWRPGRGKRQGTIGALLMGIPTEAGLQYIGRVGTGFDEGMLENLRAELDTLAQVASPFIDVPPVDAAGAQWVSPTLVGEVEFAEWTPTGKLRQPSWRGRRFDKSPGDVVRD